MKQQRDRHCRPARRALERRDGGCRFPGCGRKICDGHHIEHWADVGKTKLDNVVLLCRRHHRAVHEEGFRMDWEDGMLQFFRPDGLRLEDAPRVDCAALAQARPTQGVSARRQASPSASPGRPSAAAETSSPLPTLIEELLDDGVAIDPCSSSSKSRAEIAVATKRLRSRIR